jgi:uncharacterized protein YbjT (DUF2867 family)
VLVLNVRRGAATTLDSDSLINAPYPYAVLGGTGFLGTRLVARLIKDGHRVTVLSRDREQHKHLLVLPGLTLENCDVYEEAQLSERFRGKDVVINLVGILNERGFGGGGFRRAHTELTRASCGLPLRGSPRLLQVSALKAAHEAPSYYLRTKGEAEQPHPRARRRAGLDDISAVGDVRSGRFIPESLRGAARGDSLGVSAGQAKCQISAGVRRRCGRGAAPVAAREAACSRQTYELGGPQVYSLREIVSLVAKLTGRRRWIVGLPNFVGSLQALVMDFVPGRPFSSDNYRSLTIDSICTQDGLASLGIKPHSMLASARQYLGSLEDNARISHNRAAAGRAMHRP